MNREYVVVFKRIVLAGAIALATATAAHAAVIVTTTPGASPYVGPAPTFDFETAAPISGGQYRTNTTAGVASQPFGATGRYYAVGPIVGNAGVLNLASFASIGSVSLIWGTVDSSNLLRVLDASNNVLASVTGTQIRSLSGTATLAQRNPVVTLTFTGATRDLVNSLEFSSGVNAFEFDNVAIAPVPEPATWAMMLVGFAAIGLGMRRKARVSVRFA